MKGSIRYQHKQCVQFWYNLFPRYLVVFACAVKHKGASQLWELIPAPRIITSPSCLDSTKLRRADRDLSLRMDSIVIKPQEKEQKRLIIQRE